MKIEIKITIPEDEYKNWSDYQDGLQDQKATLKAEIRAKLKQLYIKQFEIEIL